MELCRLWTRCWNSLPVGYSVFQSGAYSPRTEGLGLVQLLQRRLRARRRCVWPMRRRRRLRGVYPRTGDYVRGGAVDGPYDSHVRQRSIQTWTARH